MIKPSKALQSQQISERRFSQFFATLPDYCYMISTSGIILGINPAACEGLGYSEQELVGKPLFMIYAPESHAKMRDLLEKWNRTGKLCNEEMVILTKHGERRTVILNVGSVLDEEGKFLHSTSVQVDITERKRMEQQLRESEERFRLVADTAPVMIWMSGADKLCSYFNQGWLEFTGRSLKDELGNGWVNRVHCEDLARCLDTYTEAFDRREAFQMEYRLLRHDGEYRWIFDQGVPRFSGDGSFAGYIGSCIDVTERKLAVEVLSTLSQKLIQAQEQERSRLARELHDDINQRLAFLAITLSGLKQRLPNLSAELGREFGEALKQVADLGTDIQGVSHRLHSPRLELLGLGKATAALCDEFCERHEVKIDFHADNIPHKLSEDISLCLFRILQEALQNAIKHSRSRHFQVWLRNRANEIELTVQDPGSGFEPKKAIKGPGLGLTSMRERLKLVDGHLSIDSKLKSGTTICARVPLSPKSSQAAGYNGKPETEDSRSVLPR